MNAVDEIKDGAYSKGSTVSGLTGGFWFIRASQSTTDNYAVCSIVTIPKPTRDTATLFEKVFLQINLYSQNLSTLLTLTNNMTAEFDDSESDWSLTSYHFIRIERNLLRPPIDLDGMFQTTIGYEIDLQKK